MNNNIKKFSILLLPLLLFSCTNNSNSSDFDENNIILSAQVLSDEHVDRNNPCDSRAIFTKALENYRKLSKKDDFDIYISGGDHTLLGTLKEDKTYLDSLISVFPNANSKLFSCFGNHDVSWPECNSREEHYSYMKENWNFYNLDSKDSCPSKGNRHCEINGVHFLTIDIDTYGPNKNTVSNETKEWFTSTMMNIQESNKNKPVFVISHAPAKNTVFGSYDEEQTGIWGSSLDLKNLLKDYSNVILLSGHTHFACVDERSIWQDTFTCVNLPSATGDYAMDWYYSGLETPNVDKETGKLLSDRYVWNCPDGNYEEAYIYSCGYLMEIDDKFNTRITRYDLRLGEVIKANRPWVIKAPKEDKSHLKDYRFDTRKNVDSAPYLKDGGCFETTYDPNTKKYSAVFDTFIDDDFVYAYDLQLFTCSKDKISDTSKPDMRWMILDEWRKYPEPSTRDIKRCFTYTFDKEFSPSDIVTIRLIALDSWNKYTIAYPNN